MARLPSPDCEQGKCSSCTGDGYDTVEDRVIDCPCPFGCHGPRPNGG